MEQIMVQIKDKHKAKILVELLTSLDFVNVVTKSKQEENSQAIKEKSVDFFSYAGLWADREIDTQSIREKAWPRQYL